MARDPSPSDGSALVYVYADESCLGNQFRERATPGGAAALVETFREVRTGYDQPPVRTDLFVCEPDSTNNRMALRSAFEVLERLGPSSVVFTSDSNYLVLGMREWVHGWAARGWRRKGGAIENLDLWGRLLRAARPHRIEWRWVRGHAGHPKNEYAHRLAIRAAERQLDSGGFVDSGFDAWLQEEMERGHFLDFYDVPPKEPFRPGPAPPPPPRAL